MFTSMNLAVLLLALERLGLVDSWCISYDQKGTLEDNTRYPSLKATLGHC
jgi:hypothetical protein